MQVKPGPVHLSNGVTFRIAQTLQRFQIFGNIRDLNDSLKMFVHGIAKFLANIFSTLILGSFGFLAFLRLSSFNFFFHTFFTNNWQSLGRTTV
jgi:hypothetical protein